MAHPDQLRITAVCGGEPDGIRKQNLIKLLSSCEWVLSNIYQFTPAGVNYELASDSKSLRVKRFNKHVVRKAIGKRKQIIIFFQI